MGKRYLIGVVALVAASAIDVGLALASSSSACGATVKVKIGQRGAGELDVHLLIM